MDPSQQYPQSQETNNQQLQSPYSKKPFVPQKPSPMNQPSLYTTPQQTYTQPFQRPPFRPNYDGQPGVSRPPPPMFNAPPSQQDNRPPPPPTTNILNPAIQKPPPPPMMTHTPPPPHLTDSKSLSAQMQKLTLEQQKPQLGNTVNTMNLDSLPRPTSETMLSAFDQPDCQPLFNRYQGVDFSKAQARSQFMRASVQCVPNSPGLLSKWGLPFGIIVQPFAELPSQETVPTVNFGSCGIVRCFKCRAYINPFVVFIEGGRRWQCNMCKCLNQVHHEYFCPLDMNGQRKDLAERKELTHGSIEFIASQEYMARVPQPPAYLFLIDVSYNAIKSGLLVTVAKTISSVLDKLPGDDRTKVGFITFDSTVHFYNLRKTLTRPQMLVVSELKESLLPLPNDLLVNLHDSKDVVESLLKGLSTRMFQHTTDGEIALGAALNAAGRVLGPVGGRLLVFLSGLPTVGPNSLSNRENHLHYGTDLEKALLMPKDNNYKELALLYSKDQICVDLFVTTSQYVDIATIGSLPKITGGATYYYPGFKAEENGKQLSHDIQRSLLREQAFEAVMRVRTSSGLKISNFYGHFFIRGHDLLALPNCDADKVFALELCHSGNFISTPNACIQAAVLYTNSNGERRIRVHTMILPITSNLTDMYRHVDINATMSLITKMAVDEAPKNGMTATRNKIKDMVVSTLKYYKETQQNISGYSSQQLVLPDGLRLLPLYICALTKHDALSGGKDVKADERVAAFQYLSTCSIEKTILSIYPCMFALHELKSLDEKGLPPLVPLTRRRVTQSGIYLIDDSQTIYVWVGKQVDENLAQAVYEAVVHSNFPELQQLNNENSFGKNVVELVKRLRERSGYMQVVFIKQGSLLERIFLKKLVEDRTPTAIGYDEFLVQLHQAVNNKIY